MLLLLKPKLSSSCSHCAWLTFFKDAKIIECDENGKPVTTTTTTTSTSTLTTTTTFTTTTVTTTVTTTTTSLQAAHIGDISCCKVLNKVLEFCGKAISCISWTDSMCPWKLPLSNYRMIWMIWMIWMLMTSHDIPSI